MSVEFPFSLLRPDVPREPYFAVDRGRCEAKLDQNEAPFDIPPQLKSELLQAVARTEWNRYTQPEAYLKARSSFAAAIGQPPERIVLTAGCDQLLLLAFHAAGGPERRARIFEPTYPMYRAFARMTRTLLEPVVLDENHDLRSHGLGDPVELLVLVRPNNPTGNGPDRALVLEALGRPGLVLVDEAYADYTGESVVDLVERHPNLLVGRSLSKASLAGVRLGYGVGHPELIRILENLVFSPYHLNALQLAVADGYRRLQPHVAESVRVVNEERERVQAGLARVGVRFRPSQANFVLFAVDDAATVYQRLQQSGIDLRDVSGFPGLDRHLRLTVGSREENDRFLTALETCLR